MKLTLTAAQSRILAAVLLLLLAAIGLDLLLWPVGLVLGDQREIGRVQRTIAQLSARAAEQDSLEEQVRRLKADGAGDDRLFGSATASQANALLQRQLNGIVASAGGRVDSLQILGEKADGPFTRLGQRLTITIPAQGLRTLLYQLEAGRPMLFADNAQIRSNNAGAGSPGNRTGADRAEFLALSVDVYGFTLAPVGAEGGDSPHPPGGAPTSMAPLPSGRYPAPVARP